MANIVSLNSLRKDEGREEEKDDEGVYVGGTDARGGGSGLSVLRNSDGADPVSDVFQRARASGAVSSSPAENARIITFYSNGFTVDNGPLRSLQDPANKSFLDDISKGVVPQELERSADGKPLHISIEDRRSEEYKAPPPPAYVAFQGEGRSMRAEASSSQSEVAVGCADWGGEKPTVDSSAPVGTVQVRLADGRRLRVTLNLFHTVGDLFNYINAENGGERPYTLSAGFPPTPLKSMDQTIEAAGLKGASVTQKYVE